MGEEKNNRFTLLNKINTENLSEMSFVDIISPEVLQKIKEKYGCLFSNTKYHDSQVYYYDLIINVKTYYLYFTRNENESYFTLKIYYPETKIEELKIFINSLLKQK